MRSFRQGAAPLAGRPGGMMPSQQITCLHGQCDDPLCGFAFVYVGRQRVPSDLIVRDIETAASNYWTVVGGECVPVVIGTHAETGRPVITAEPKGLQV